MQNLSCENEFYLHENETHFRINGFALSLALKQRLGATWKWPIAELEEYSGLECAVYPVIQNSITLSLVRAHLAALTSEVLRVH